MLVPTHAAGAQRVHAMCRVPEYHPHENQDSPPLAYPPLAHSPPLLPPLLPPLSSPSPTTGPKPPRHSTETASDPGDCPRPLKP